MRNEGRAFGRLWERIDDLCRLLRGEDGCAWDRAQTAEGLAPFLLEETHELLEALALGDRERLVEETGDAVYLWTFFLGVLESEGRIDLDDVAERVEAKLTRRHPHVFGTEDAATDRSAFELWERRKRLEATDRREVLRSLPAALPALMRARRLQEKAAAYGFDWTSADEVIPKIQEEIGELLAASQNGTRSPAVREELGDLLFAVVNLARHLYQDPEAALLAATEKFRDRFNEMARSVEESGHQLGEAPLDLLESHWQAVKSRSTRGTPPSDRP